MKRTLLISTLVGFLALCAVAWGASQITGSQIKNSTITGKDVKNRSLTPRDFKGSVRGPQGERGPQGVQGPQGPAGPINAAGMTRVEASIVVAAGDVDSAEAFCPAGQQLITSQFESTGADSEVFYMSDFGVRNSIAVGLDNFDSLIEADVTAIVWCVPAGRAVVARGNRARLTRKANAQERLQRAAHEAADNAR